MLEWVKEGKHIERGVKMGFIDKTMKFDFSEEPFDQDIETILSSVHEALSEKGYNPINQIVGYLLSGDPAFAPLPVCPITGWRFRPLLVKLTAKITPRYRLTL